MTRPSIAYIIKDVFNCGFTGTTRELINTLNIQAIGDVDFTVRNVQPRVNQLFKQGFIEKAGRAKTIGTASGAIWKRTVEVAQTAE